MKSEVETPPAVGVSFDVDYQFEDEISKTNLYKPFTSWVAGMVIGVKGLSYLFARERSSRMFVFEETADLLTLWRNSAVTSDEWGRPLPPAEPYLVVLGTPGISKSGLAQLAATRTILVDRDPVIIVCGLALNVYILQWKGEKLRCKQCNIGQMNAFVGDHKDNYVLVYDSPVGVQKSAVGEMSAFKRALVVHSPSADVKNTSKSGIMKVHIFGVPSLEEILRFNNAVGIQLPSGMLDSQEVVRRYLYAGPSLRFIFTDSWPDVKNNIEQGLLSMVRLQLDVLNGNVIADDKKDNAVHCVLQLMRDRTYRFMSPTIEREYYEKVKKDNLSNMLRFVLKDHDSATASARGVVFEMCMHAVFSVPNTRITVGTSNKMRELRTFSISELGKIFTRLEDLGCVEEGILYRPFSSIFPTLDSFILLRLEEGLTLVTLQCTVADKHAINYSTLLSLYNHVNAEWLSNNKNRMLVPMDTMASRTRAKEGLLKGDTKKDADGREFVKVLHVMLVPIHSNMSGSFLKVENLADSENLPQERWYVHFVNDAKYWPSEPKGSVEVEEVERKLMETRLSLPDFAITVDELKKRLKSMNSKLEGRLEMDVEKLAQEGYTNTDQLGQVKKSLLSMRFDKLGISGYLADYLLRYGLDDDDHEENRPRKVSKDY